MRFGWYYTRAPRRPSMEFSDAIAGSDGRRGAAALGGMNDPGGP